MKQIIHEGGLTAHSKDQSLSIRARHDLRPVLVREARDSGNLDLLLSTTGQVLNLKSSELYSPQIAGSRLLPLSFALAYDVNSCLHHCASLAVTYESIIKDYHRLARIPGISLGDSGMVSMGYQPTPYFEFDALVSAARRAFDKIGHYVWQAFEGSGGGRPDNFADLIPRLRHCPLHLAGRLSSSWSAFGSRLKEYRDCTQHFASMDMGFGTGVVMVKKLDDTEWRAWARIPDNPDARSRKNFKYEAGLDALTYGWETTNEVLNLAAEVVATPP